MSFKQGLSLDRGIGFGLVPPLKILREVVEFWENKMIFKREMLCVVEGGNQCAVHGLSSCA